MRAYNYLLFRIFRFYTDVLKETQMPLLYTSGFSTIFIFINLYSVLGLLHYNDMISLSSNNYIYLVYIVLLWFGNHFLIVEKKRFLEMNFSKTIKGGWIVVIYLVFTVVFYIAGANLNRAKVFKNKELHNKEQVKQKPSLEEDIRKWFRENF